MLAQSPAQVPVKYVSVQCKGGLLTVLYGSCRGGLRVLWYHATLYHKALCLLLFGVSCFFREATSEIKKARYPKRIRRYKALESHDNNTLRPPLQLQTHVELAIILAANINTIVLNVHILYNVL